MCETMARALLPTTEGTKEGSEEVGNWKEVMI
jgi:hypothetical protein